MHATRFHKVVTVFLDTDIRAGQGRFPRRNPGASKVSNKDDFGAAKISENLETAILRHYRHAVSECN